MSKMYIVQGTHWYEGSRHMTLHRSKKGASKQAARLVNLLLESLRDLRDEDDPMPPKNCTWKNHEEVLQEARRYRAASCECSVDDLDEDDADVWVEAFHVRI